MPPARYLETLTDEEKFWDAFYQVDGYSIRLDGHFPLSELELSAADIEAALESFECIRERIDNLEIELEAALIEIVRKREMKQAPVID